MNDFRRRNSFRAIFLISAMCPVLLIVVWLFGGSNSVDWEGKASSLTGWSVTIGNIDDQQDPSTILTDVVFRDQRIGTAAQLDWVECRSDANQATFIARHLEIDSLTGHSWLHDVCKRLLIQQNELPSALNGVVQRLSIRPLTNEDSTHTGITIETVDVDYEEADQARILNIQFRLAGDVDRQPCLFRIECLPNNEVPTAPNLEWTFQTGDSSVPCHVVRDWLPIAESLGEEARFRGQVLVKTLADHDRIEIAGEFSNVDLASLITDHFPHSIYGSVDIFLPKLVVLDGRIRELNGSISGRHGQVDRRCIESAIQNFQFREYSNLASDPVVYRDLNIHIAMDQNSLIVRGDPDSGTIALTQEGHPWLIEAAVRQVSPTALIRWLVPISGTEVPVTEETAGLVALLPIPSQRLLNPSASGASRIRME